MVYYKFFGGKRSKFTHKVGVIGVSLIAFIEISFINYIVVYDGILSGIIVITYVVYAQYFLHENLNSHIFVAIFAMAIICTISSVLIFIFSYLAEITTNDMISEFTIWRVMAICFCGIFKFLAFKVILRICSTYALTRKEWIMFIAMPLSTWVAVIFMTQTTMKAPSVLPQMFYIAVLMLAINVVIYFFMFKIKQDTETKIEYELLRMQHDNIRNM